MDIFPESDLYSGSNGQKPKLTDGHIWNEKYAQQFASPGNRALILSQRVILCDTCNSLSGSKNEVALIDFQKFRETKQSGGYIDPEVNVVSKFGTINPGRVRIRFDQATSRLHWEYPKGSRGQNLYNPSDEAAFSEFLQQGDCCKSFLWAVKEKYQAPKKWQKAQAALITSAYLQLFHTFGYPYVFNTKLNPVREYICNSLNFDASNKLEPAPEKQVSVGVCGHGHHNPEPKIAISPPDGNRFQILEVNFMDYHMRLPFPADYIEESELCEECGEETGEVNKNIVLDAPDDEIVDTVRDKLEAYR